MHPTFAFNAEPGFNSMRGDVMHFEMKVKRLSKHNRYIYIYEQIKV